METNRTPKTIQFFMKATDSTHGPNGAITTASAVAQLMLVLVVKKGEPSLQSALVCQSSRPSGVSSIVYIGMQLVSPEWLPVHHTWVPAASQRSTIGLGITRGPGPAIGPAEGRPTCQAYYQTLKGH